MLVEQKENVFHLNFKPSQRYFCSAIHGLTSKMLSTDVEALSSLPVTPPPAPPLSCRISVKVC
jgi:hypothetical protein